MTNPSRDQEEELPESFQPSKYDVIVGWARQNYHHEGNQMLRDIVRDNVPRYIDAKTKHEKGIIIIEILESLKAKSPSGLALLRQNPNTKRWFYIGTDKAKDKIGHALRKASRDMSNGHERSPMRKPKARNSIGASKNRDSNHHCPSPLAVPSLSYRPETSSSAAFSLASPGSAFNSSDNSMARKSFKTGPYHVGKTTATTTALESWPLTSVTSLSSSESHSEELLQLHHRQPVQVTVPSSPVTRPSSSASDHNNSTVVSAAPLPPPASHYHHHRPGYHHHPPRGAPLETHYEAEAGHGYYGLYHHHHNHHHHPQYPYHHPHHHYGKDGYDYHRYHASRSYGGVGPAAGDRYTAPESREAAPTVLPPPSYDHDTANDDRAAASAAAAGEYSSQYPASARVHLYDNVEVPPPPATPTDGGSSSSFQRVFDEVDRRLQQEEQQQHAAAAHHGHASSYHHHLSPQQPHHYYHHPPPTHSSSTPEGPYARIVSHEGLATPSGM